MSSSACSGGVDGGSCGPTEAPKLDIEDLRRVELVAAEEVVESCRSSRLSKV